MGQGGSHGQSMGRAKACRNPLHASTYPKNATFITLGENTVGVIPEILKILWA
jgi:hypothetical protein